MSDSDKDFEQRVKSALDSGANGLDAATRRQLAAMRAQAFECRPWWSRWLSFEDWKPAAAFAAVAVLTVSLLLIPSSRDVPSHIALQENDIALEVLFGEDGHEEAGDPDFYAWLDLTLLEEEESKHAG